MQQLFIILRHNIHLITIVGVIVVVLVGGTIVIWDIEYKRPAKMQMLEASYKRGNVHAAYVLGIMYGRGSNRPFVNDIPPDDKTAVKWLRLAAEQGHADAQFELGKRYTAEGHGVPINLELVEKWFRRAAEQGHAQAASGMRSMGWKFTPYLTFSKAGTFPNVIEEGNAQPKKRNQYKRNKIVERTAPEKSPPSNSGSTGSGFFVSKWGHVLTNAHVVRNCGSITVGDNAKKQVTTVLLETDKRNDLALLKIPSTQMASAETKSLIRKLGLKLVPKASEGLLRSDDVELGEDVLVSGFPYGELYSNTIKVTKGIVSANRGIGDDTGQFQIDAAVQPGNSGGPIYDGNGNIVGVVVAQLNKLKFAKAIGSLPENVNFGIKASTVRQFLTASGLPTKWSQRSQAMSTKELAKIAKNQTVMVVCNP